MKAKTTRGNSAEEIKTSLEECMSVTRLSDGQAFKPTIAIVFISVKQDRKVICEILDEKGLEIIRATSSGESTESMNFIPLPIGWLQKKNN